MKRLMAYFCPSHAMTMSGCHEETMHAAVHAAEVN